MVLHRLSAKLTPQMPTDKALLASKDGKVEGWLDERDMVNGVDVMEAVRGFTLIPNVQKKFGARILEKPYRPAVARIIEKGAYHNLLMQGKDKQGENLVLFYVDQGTINLSMVEKLLGEDGRRRNLNWALEGHQDGDIIPFGVGKDGKSRSSSANEEYEREYMDDEEGEKRTRRSNPGVPPRYIIRFTDAIEARRFVRSWHTRVLDGEPWDTIGASGKWAGGMVNAEILW